jgi:hypothetical protein
MMAAMSYRICVYKLRMECEECGGAVFLNGPMLEVTCGACLSRLKLDSDTWKSLIEDGDESYEEMGEKRYMTGNMWSGGRKYVYYTKNEQPRCPACKETLDLSKLDPLHDEEVFCPSCGQGAPTFPTPDWLRAELPRARQVFCAKREGESDDAAPDRDALKPIMMSCLHCGGALEITSETERVVPCEFCDTDHYLPDDLWRRMHPIKKRTPFFVFFGDADINCSKADPRPAVGPAAARDGRPVRYTKCAKCGIKAPTRSCFYTEIGELCSDCYRAWPKRS